MEMISLLIYSFESNLIYLLKYFFKKAQKNKKKEILFNHLRKNLVILKIWM